MNEVIKYKVIITNKQHNVFGKNTTRVRVVAVPTEEVRKCVQTEDILEKIFFYGQNDFQNVKGCPSVSFGDIVIIGSDFYACEPLGWLKVEQFA